MMTAYEITFLETSLRHQTDEHDHRHRNHQRLRMFHRRILRSDRTDEEYHVPDGRGFLRTAELGARPAR